MKEGDIFDECVRLEDDHLKEGYEKGFADGLVSVADGLVSVADKEDGRQVGLKNGFEVGQELGFYRGIIDVWNSAIRVDPTCFKPRVVKSIKQMEEALNKYPILDPEDESTTDLQISLRLKFKAICSGMNVNMEYEGYHKASSDSGLTDF